MDYSSDGIGEQEIFTGGLTNSRKGMLLEEVRDLQAGLGSGGPSGSAGGFGLDGIYFDMPRNPSSVLPTASFGLEGLGADLAYLRSSEGYGAGDAGFSGSIGRSSPQFGPAISLPGSTSGEQVGVLQGCGGPSHEDDSVHLPRTGDIGKAKAVKKTQKDVKIRVRKDQLVLGVDVSLAEAEDLSLVAVVGRARGKRFGPSFLRRWAAKN